MVSRDHLLLTHPFPFLGEEFLELACLAGESAERFLPGCFVVKT